MATVVMALPSGAAAATQVGQLPPGDPSAACTSGVSTIQGPLAAGNSYLVPSDGVITSWSHRGDADVPGSGKLQVWRPATGAFFTLVDRSDAATFAAGIASPIPTRIPVRAGDSIGLFTVAFDNGCHFGTGDFVDAIRVVTMGPEPAPGDDREFVFSVGAFRVNVSATLEADTDADGFGDETQDQCPTDASTQGTCPPGEESDTTPPETTITKGPNAKTKKTTATFEFSGTDARAIAGFECSLDGGAFASCTSPHTVKVKRGRHTFEARAIDTAGYLDASAATYAWKVKRKKKKRRA